MTADETSGAPRLSVTPSTTVLKAIAKVTFFEIIRDRVLYNIIVCAVLLLGVGVLASQLTFVRPDRILLDFGLSAISISSGFLAVFIGAGMLGREFERRTIHVALTRPVSRFQFLLGKYLGLLWVVTVNFVMLSAIYLVTLCFMHADITLTLGLALLMILLQSCMLGAFSVMFSTFSTTSLSAIITLGLYLIGTNISQVRYVAVKLKDTFWHDLLNLSAVLLPNFEYFNWGTKVTYGLPVSFTFVLASVAYGMVGTAVVLLVAGFLIYHKEA